MTIHDIFPYWDTYCSLATREELLIFLNAHQKMIVTLQQTIGQEIHEIHRVYFQNCLATLEKEYHRQFTLPF